MEERTEVQRKASRWRMGDLVDIQTKVCIKSEYRLLKYYEVRSEIGWRNGGTYGKVQGIIWKGMENRGIIWAWNGG